MKASLSFSLLALLLCASASSLGQDKKKPEKKIEPRVAVALPLGAAPGQTTKITLRGIKLDEAKEVKVIGDHAKAKIVSKGKANVPDKNPEQVGDTQVQVELTLEPKLPGAPIQIVVVTEAGETKPHLFLVETKRPLVPEKEANDGFKQAQKVALPAVVEGTVDRPRDVDVFEFEGKAGQKVTLEVIAARYGSPLDSILTVYTEAGVQIANNDDAEGSVDAKLEVTLPAAGKYLAVLMDAHDTGSAIHAYRLVMEGK